VTAALDIGVEFEPPAEDELAELEDQLIRHVRVIVGFLGTTRAAEALGRSPSWVSRALSPNRDQRLASRCRFYLEDLVLLLRAAREQDNHELIEFLAGQAFGEQLPADEVAAAWDEVAREQLGEVAGVLRSKVLARALVKRLRRAPMRTKRSEGR
jgi:hypothetical protein